MDLVLDLLKRVGHVEILGGGGLDVQVVVGAVVLVVVVVRQLVGELLVRVKVRVRVSGQWSGSGSGSGSGFGFELVGDLLSEYDRRLERPATRHVANGVAAAAQDERRQLLL